MQNFPAPKMYTAKLSEKEVLNDKFMKYHFELIEPTKIEFLSGQYVSFIVSEKGERRSYSISSSPALNHSFEVTVDITPDGLGVTFFKNLEFGEEVKVLGPLGKFVLQDEPKEDNLVFIATGSGVAPFKSMVLDLLQSKKDSRKIILYWGLRHAEDMIWQDEFQELSQNFPQFHFHPVLSKAQQEWPLCRGHVTDCIGIHDLPEKAGYYLCGAKQMIADVQEVLLKRGVSEEAIHFEKFD